MSEQRVATEADIESVLAFWRAAEAITTPTDDAAALRSLLDHPTAFLLLALEKGQLAGTIIGAFDGWRGGIYRLVVSPHYRRQGLGRRLVSDATARLEALGARRIAAIARADEEEAIAFWDSVGIGYARAEPNVRFARG